MMHPVLAPTVFGQYLMGDGICGWGRLTGEPKTQISLSVLSDHGLSLLVARPWQGSSTVADQNSNKNLYFLNFWIFIKS